MTLYDFRRASNKMNNRVPFWLGLLMTAVITLGPTAVDIIDSLVRVSHAHYIALWACVLHTVFRHSPLDQGPEIFLVKPLGQVLGVDVFFCEIACTRCCRSTQTGVQDAIYVLMSGGISYIFRTAIPGFILS